MNFTQYTIYDPYKSLSAAAFSTSPQFYRLLDQLIAVLSQYKGGKNDYRHYLHLHTEKDLEEAELRHLQDLNGHSNVRPASPRQPVQFCAETSHSNTESNAADPWLLRLGIEPIMFSENTILESFAIKNLLMNPKSMGPEPAMAKQEPRSTRFSPLVELNANESPDQYEHRDFSCVSDPGLISTSFDSDAFVNLIQNQHYYWVLDLFNEIDVWRTIIPSYCVRLVQAGETDEKSRKKNSSFLLNCLIDCKEFTTMELVLCNARKQLVLWKMFENRDVTAASLKDFEQILLSIVLILLSMLLQVVRPTFLLTDSFVKVLANQGRMFRKVVARYERCPEQLAKTMARSLVSATSFQAIVILRFFLQKNLQKLDIPHNSLRVNSYNEEDILASNITYDLDVDYNVDEFFLLTPFEEKQVVGKFHEFDISECDERNPSDSAKLRRFFWSLVEFDIGGGTADSVFLETIQAAVENSDKDTSAWALRPSDKCIALNILASYAHNITTDATPQNTKLHKIFEKINQSMSLDKSYWTSHFRWTLDG